MAARIGSSNFYLNLKDRSLKIEDRLKLLRYSWKSGDVFIPNKEQVLVDILTGFLINKKKEQLSEGDVERVWECLCDVLKTRRASEPNRLLLRQSSIQMLSESLLTANDSCGFILPLVGCFEAIMRSDSLSTVFTMKLDTMVLVLKGLCGVLAIDSVKSESLVSSVVHHTVDRFIKALKTAPNQNQILQKMCDLVLPKLIGLWSARPSDSAEKISTAIQAVLCHRDHHQSYDIYLKAKHSKSGTHIHKKAKYVEHLFTTLAKLLQTNQELRSLYLPVVFENYIEHNCHKGIHLTAHYLMKELCSLTGLHSDSNKLSGQVKTSVVFRTLHQLLKIIQGRELYDQHLDEKNEAEQFKFYRHIVHFLITCKQSNDDEDNCDVIYCDWYSCLTVLLQLNHHIVEPRLLEIFSIGWIETEVKEEDTEALDEMLCELVTIYSKLRQIPKLITKLLGTLCVCDGNTVLQLTPRFLICYGEVIQALPQGLMLDVWKKIAAPLKAHFANPETKQDAGHFQGICLLFHHFLLNVKVADYTVTDLTLKSVQELLVVMETEMLSPLLKETIDSKDVNKLKYTLFLSQAWGEVVAMLALYTKHRASEFQTKVLVSHEGDLSYVHGYLERKKWMKLYKMVSQHEDPNLLYVWDMLMVQKVRTMLLFRDVSDWSVISDTMATFITYLKDAEVKDTDAPWSGRLEDITANNLQTARWHLLSSNMAAIYTVLSEEQLKNLADFIVRCAVTCKTTCSVKSFSLGSISKEFLKSAVMRESGHLLSFVVTSVWKNCGIIFSSRNQKSPKKKKHDAVTTNITSLISVIGDSDLSWPRHMNSEGMGRLKEASEALTMIWSNTNTVHIGDLRQLQECVKIIRCLPLEHLWSCDQIRCLIGLLAVECLTGRFEDQFKCESIKELSCDCMELCTYILESCGTVPVFQVIDAESFLDWLHTLLGSSSLGITEYYKCLVLTEVTSQAVVREVGTEEKVASFTDKLCREMKKDQETNGLTLTLFLLQEICKLLSKPFLKDDVKETCNKMYNSVSKSVLKLSPLLESSNRSHKEAVLMRTYAVVLTAAHKNENVEKVFLENFSDMFFWCETVLKNMETTDVYTVLSALIFLYTVSKHHILLKLQLGIEDKLRIWKLLTAVLRKLLSAQSAASMNKPHSESVCQPTVIEKQSDSRKLSQSVEESPDSQSEQDKLDTKSRKKKRKSERKTAIHVCDSITGNTDSNDDITRQIMKINELLQGSFETTTENVFGTVSGRVLNVENLTLEIDDTVLNPAMMSSLCRSLMFEGQLEFQRSKVIRMQVQSVMAALLVTFDLEQLKEVLQELVDNVHTSALYTDRGSIQSSLYIWRHLLKLEFSDEQNKVIKYSAKDMMLNFQCISQQLQHVLLEDVVVDITIPILHTQQQMLTSGQKFLPSRSSILCLYSCLYTPLGGSTYFPAFSAVYSVLDTLLVHHAETVFQNIPAFLSCAKRLLLSVVEQSNQDKISQLPEVIKQLMACAYQMERLFSCISSHKVEFGKVAMYVVSDYVTAVQKVTLLPAIKRALVPAVYKMLDLCDKHAISQLHVVLSHGVTEVFRLLYKEYTKFHKYQGKI
ncbi:unhealthy ribosome biogenesis protein 2 homolog isoform X2 [Mercenaria mercenaria]|uniref:unhealthy ribosome biogenesis protein 2 homolog isoform X2 n=1 Tax=Mercenaria mercenaria TaxID=6596 RepID=UPI00234E723D|nr:unhealthy ribosome biogenesis protein 2 homolog isoform X2 [Mercenaria mercenaria]